MTETDRPELESADEQRLDADNPWPGLAYFRERDEKFFRGRDAEAESLERLVLRDRLTVMFGASGLGKTSLLQAGLFPLLRHRPILPVYIRLDFSERELDLRRQVLDAVVRAAANSEVEAPAPDPGRTLWEYFHRKNADFWNVHNRLVTPLLVFDQFEEIFTLGQTNENRVSTNDLVGELADLIEGHPPEQVRSRLDAVPKDAREFSYKRHPYKVLLSLREDFLPHLEELRDQIPSLAHNRLRLRRMTGKSAMKVVERDPPLVSNGVAKRIVRFVAAPEEGLAEVSLADLEIEPAQLSVVCRELNSKRRALREPMITADLLEGTGDQILIDLYEQSVADVSPELRALIEERLLTVSGFRDSIALENALETPGVSAEQIDTLIKDRRLLRAEESDKVRRIELTHDLLTGVIAESRDARRRREAEEAKEAELREKRRRSWRRNLSLLLVVALGLAVVLWQERDARKEAQKEAEAAQEEANHLRDEARRKSERQKRALADFLTAERGCDGGDADACLRLVSIIGASRALRLYERATELTTQACRGGAAAACAKLGGMYESGEAGVMDTARAGAAYKRAAGLYQRGCNSGDPESCAGLATLHDRGRGVDQDAAQAAELRQRACEAGFSASCSSLGVMLQWGRGPPRNETRAAELFEQACGEGSADGCYNLGVLYRWGSSVDRNEADARKLHTRACEAGSADGCLAVGRFFWKEGDYVQAAEFFEDACYEGSELGCRWLGWAYERGRGDFQGNLVRAVSLYEQACSRGMPSACFRLGFWEAFEDVDARAVGAYQRACDGGHGGGCLRLGLLFENGRGIVDRDEQRAALLFQQACNRGNARSCELLRLHEQACNEGDLRSCRLAGTTFEGPEVARKTRDQVLALASKCEEGAAEVCFDLASFYTRNGEYKEAASYAELYEHAVGTMKDSPGFDQRVHAHRLANLATLYASRSEYTKATPIYIDAIKAYKTSVEGEAPDEAYAEYLQALTSLGLIYLYRGKYDEAEQSFQDALDKQESVQGKRHASYAELLSLRALVYARTDRPAHAEADFLDALAIRCATGPEGALCASNLIDLGLLYEKAGWDLEAQPHYERALSIARRASGRNTPYYTTSVNNLANLYIQTGQYPKAEELLRSENLLATEGASGAYDLLYKATLDNLESVIERSASVERD